MKSVWFAAAVLASTAHAQWVGDFQIERSRPVPEVSRQMIQSLATRKPIKPRPHSESEKLDALRVGEHLRATYTAQLAPLKSRPECGQMERRAFLLALLTSGQFESCVLEARRCSQQSQFGENLVGAMCAVAAYDHSSASDLFLAATDERWRDEQDFSYAVFQFASYQFTSPHPELTAERLKLNPRWSKNERRILEATIELFSRGKTSLATDREIEAILTGQDGKTAPQLNELFKILWVTYPTLDYNWNEALNRLKISYDQWTNPLSWTDLAYALFFSQDTQSFALARHVYEGFLPYAHPRMRLPLEQNVYTYSEIESTVCPNAVLHGDQAAHFQQAKQQWQAGEKSTASLKLDAENLQKSNPTSDVLVVLGSLKLADGELSEARNLYWQAHLLCPYYNRAHWGLALIRRQERFNSYPDRVSLEEKMRQDLKAHPPAQALGQYILNWSNLTDSGKDAVAYGSRVWRDYVASLKRSERFAYIKSVFELLSETPGMSDLRDVRISYDGDNRLWDDVRGAGGEIVIADLIEVQQTVLGAYNLLGHEMTHQFHSFVRTHSPEVARCNSHLFQMAKARDRFADGYARTNEDEYLAQGMTYDMIAEDSHPRFGLNRSWIKEFDPDLFDFLQSIKGSAGNLGAIRCPN